MERELIHDQQKQLTEISEKGPCSQQEVGVGGWERIESMRTKRQQARKVPPAPSRNAGLINLLQVFVVNNLLCSHNETHFARP